MTPYFYITSSLLLSPLIGKLISRKFKRFPKIKNITVCALYFMTFLTCLCLENNIITISQNLNWFLITSTYLTLSVLLWSIQSKNNQYINKTGIILRYIIFGPLYFIATFGFLFILIASSDLETDQRKWLSDRIIYNERNIGQGPDPWERLKKIEVYRTVNSFPFLAYRIKSKIYDEYHFSLQKQLDVSFTKRDNIIHLKSFVKGYKDFNDTINLSQKYR